MAKFYKNLKEYVKDEIVKKDRLEELAKYIEYTVRIDDRFYERQRKKYGGVPSLRWTPGK